MAELARHFDEGPLPLCEIARKEDLSEKFLEQIVLHLKPAGFVTAVRGPKGGYLLSVPPAKIRLKSLFEAFEGSSGIVESGKNSSASKGVRYCASRQLWLTLERGISETLNSLTLADLITTSPKCSIAISFAERASPRNLLNLNDLHTDLCGGKI